MLGLGSSACGSVVIEAHGASSSASATAATGGIGGSSSATGSPSGAGGAAAGVSGSGGTGGPPDCSVPKISVLAAHQTQINWIALDATNVYWSNEDFNKSQGQIRTMPKAGGSVTDLVTTKASPRQLAVDGDRVYWSEVIPAKVMGMSSAKTTIYSIAKAGGASAKKELTWDPGAFSTGLSVDQGRVYWSDSQGAIHSVAKSGDAGVTTVLSGEPAFSLDRDGVKTDQDSIYWLEMNGRVMSMAKGGGAPKVVADVPENSFYFAMDEDRVYLGDTGAGKGTGQMVSAPKAGGPVTTLVADTDGVLAIAVNASCVYWTTHSLVVNKLRAVLKGGGEPILITPVEMSGGALAADESGVYWEESSTHSLMRATK